MPNFFHEPWRWFAQRRCFKDIWLQDPLALPSGALIFFLVVWCVLRCVAVFSLAFLVMAWVVIVLTCFGWSDQGVF